jgi:hypothetical protein
MNPRRRQSRRKRRHPSWRGVIAELARQTGIPPSCLSKSDGSRGQPLAAYWQLAMALLIKLSHMSLPAVACVFGGLNHTICLHAKRRVPPVLDVPGLDECDTDPAVVSTDSWPNQRAVMPDRLWRSDSIARCGGAHVRTRLLAREGHWRQATKRCLLRYSPSWLSGVPAIVGKAGSGGCLSAPPAKSEEPQWCLYEAECCGVLGLFLGIGHRRQDQARYPGNADSRVPPRGLHRQ